MQTSRLRGLIRGLLAPACDPRMAPDPGAGPSPDALLAALQSAEAAEAELGAQAAALARQAAACATQAGEAVRSGQDGLARTLLRQRWQLERAAADVQRRTASLQQHQAELRTQLAVLQAQAADRHAASALHYLASAADATGLVEPAVDDAVEASLGQVECEQAVAGWLAELRADGPVAASGSF